MKRILFLALALVTQSQLLALGNEQILAAADTAYKIFVTPSENRDDLRWEFKKSPEYREIRESLEKSFAAVNDADRRKIAEPAIRFAESLKLKMSNADQVVKDAGITHPTFIKDIKRNIPLNGYTHYYALMFYGLEHAYLYTLSDLTKKQQEIDVITTSIVNCVYSPSTDYKSEFKALKKSPIIKQLRKEVAISKKNSNTRDEIMNALTDFTFFIQLLELKLTNSAVIAQRYSMHDPEIVQSLADFMTMYCSNARGPGMLFFPVANYFLDIV